jgi:hypothetical protein
MKYLSDKREEFCSGQMLIKMGKFWEKTNFLRTSKRPACLPNRRIFPESGFKRPSIIFHGGGLSGSVRTQKTINLAAFNGKGKIFLQRLFWKNI